MLKTFLVSIDYNAIDLSVVDHLDELDELDDYDTEIQTETAVAAANEEDAIEKAIDGWNSVYCVPGWCGLYDSITTKEL
jgi:hypothetical protein